MLQFHANCHPSSDLGFVGPNSDLGFVNSDLGFVNSDLEAPSTSMRHSPAQRQSPPCPPPYTPPPPPPPPPPPLAGCAPIDEALMDAPAGAGVGGPSRPPVPLKARLGTLRLLLTTAAPLPPFPSPMAAPRAGASEGAEGASEGAVSVGSNQAPS